ncbi:hypothetical protein [Thiolapillus sp.]
MTPLRGWLTVCLSLCVLPPVLAVEELQLSMDAVVGEGWKANGLALSVSATDEDSAQLTIDVDSLQVGDQALERIQLVCPSIQLDRVATPACSEGKLHIAKSAFGAVSGEVSGQFFDADRWRLNVYGVRFSKAELNFDLRFEDAQLHADISLSNFRLSLLKDYLPSGWEVAGVLNARGKLLLAGSAPTAATVSMQLADFSYSSQDGLQVGENLSVSVNADASRAGDAWQGKATLRLLEGQLYTDPFFIEVNTQAPLELSLQGGLDTKTSQLDIAALSFTHGAYLTAQGDMTLELSSAKLARMNLDFRVRDLGQAYAVLLQPLLIGSALDDMAVSGQAHGKVQFAQESLQTFSLGLRQVDVEQNAGLFGLSGVAADIHWRRSGQPRRSRLGWSQGHLYRIAFGELDADFSANAGAISLQPLSLPVLDGWLQLQDLQVGGLLEGNLSWQTRAGLKDIQLRTLSQSLGWPELSGSLQATIPRLYYQDAVLRMDGELLVDAFGGRLVVEGLKLEDPLGVAPVLETSVRLDDLDLEHVTQVFDFGRIEGSLEGYVRNLRLVGWQVTSFDASLRSPGKDKRPHRISQRAIDNLTELGNGASVNLSATMLRFFEDFAYEQLALKVRLRGAVAELDGVPNPGGGYYIVKGARLPRIDVIGRNHKVAWKDLLSRIRDIRFDDMIVE